MTVRAERLRRPPVRRGWLEPRLFQSGDCMNWMIWMGFGGCFGTHEPCLSYLNLLGFKALLVSRNLIPDS